jgi:hypothetical protein
MNHLIARFFYINVRWCALQWTWLQVSSWEIESNIIHNFVDELGVANENKGYVPPHVLLAGYTQFGPDAVVVIIDVKAQQAILDNIQNKNQGSNSKNILNKGKGH